MKKDIEYFHQVRSYLLGVNREIEKFIFVQNKRHNNEVLLGSYYRSSINIRTIFQTNEEIINIGWFRNKYIFIQTMDNNVKIYELNTMKLVCMMSNIASVDIISLDKRLYSLYKNGTVRVYKSFKDALLKD